ncbi:MAG: Nif3-like dinuclear metal center hexameric protein [Vicingaceae bacterium]|nr:Nif3-like dinuclear metal center hexameric protein [Vicingaceae bacterium]
MLVKDITKVIEAFAPLSYQESYDNSGLIVGNENDDVSGILICLDCVEEIVDEAIATNCNMIIAHHPIVFSGLKKLNGKNYIERTVIKAIKNNVAIYAVHTNLDNVKNGVSFKISEKIGLKNCEILQPKKRLLSKIVTYCPIDSAEKIRAAMFKVGAGSIGDYSECSFNTDGVGTFKGNQSTTPSVGNVGELHHENETRIETVIPSHLVSATVAQLKAAHPYEEVAYDVFELQNTYGNVGSGLIGELENEEDELSFLKRLKIDLNTDCVRYTDLLGNKIKKVALCGGSGSFLLADAKARKADVFITGDFKYHQFFDAENKILIADVGHYESEQYTSELIYDIVNEKFPNFAVRLTEKNTNPVNYL